MCKEERLKQDRIESTHLTSNYHKNDTKKNRKRTNKEKKMVIVGTSQNREQQKQEILALFAKKKANHVKKDYPKYAN